MSICRHIVQIRGQMSMSSRGCSLTWYRCIIDANSYCIAVPVSSGSLLEWKVPSECVWDDQEFSQNGLQIRSKLVFRNIVEQHAATTKTFYTEILKLSDAGICELLRDL